MICLFCNSKKDFNTVEHIIPESLGNKELVLKGEVCDKCQKHLSKIERYVLSNTPMGFWRTILGIKTKKGKFASVDFNKSTEDRGILPDAHKHHDNISFIARDYDLTELIVHNSSQDQFEGGMPTQVKYVITPKVVFEIGRFLGKIGLELLCLENSQNARKSEFDQIRRYIRSGLARDIWPIFYQANGDISDLVKYKYQAGCVTEEVFCYDYSIFESDGYVVFNFTVGIDNWAICLNEMFPDPRIIQKLEERGVKVLWYSRTSWEKSKSKA
ncbi:HNH endonuclease [Chitinophaga sp. GCM10012297]|uniref:HNH endonuclease 5 domain-containing protein n=1 Tax=Chitinophaga chungangae TaxID=2821488 RepID=A0ABS3YJQ5_9BACT|nr:HNH endonuclease [Chitinophaga chungangae]MBO9154675.1 hypothetical protein [Chitinophaga chungangae]